MFEVTLEGLTQNVFILVKIFHSKRRGSINDRVHAIINKDYFSRDFKVSLRVTSMATLDNCCLFSYFFHENKANYANNFDR